MPREATEEEAVEAARLFQRYQEFQKHARRSEEDAARVQAVAGLLDSSLPALIDAFYMEIERHPDAAKSSPEARSRSIGAKPGSCPHPFEGWTGSPNRTLEGSGVC